MISVSDLDRIVGADAVDAHQDPIGQVSQVYVDADTDRPTWAAVQTGLFGLSESLVPLDGAEWRDGVLHVPVEKARVKDAPRVDPDSEISADDEQRLVEYYGITGSRSGSTEAAPLAGRGGDTIGGAGIPGRILGDDAVGASGLTAGPVDEEVAGAEHPGPSPQGPEVAGSGSGSAEVEDEAGHRRLRRHRAGDAANGITSE